MSAGFEIFVAGAFSDARVSASRWDALIDGTGTVFQTRSWLLGWWETFGRGRLLLVGAERDGQLVALAPLFLDSGMVFFVGSGGSDYLEFIGDASEPGITVAMLAAAREAAGETFLGFLFYHVPDRAHMHEHLLAAGAHLGLNLFDQGSQPAPVLAIRGNLPGARAIANKPRHIQYDRVLRRDGEVTVKQLRSRTEIEGQLDQFFGQHVERWADTAHPSQFNEPAQRAFFRRICELGTASGWLRFTLLAWNGEPIAFHFGFFHGGRYIYYKPTYSIAHARRSPGQVLLHHVLNAAIDEGADLFDFGLGDEGYKHRFATAIDHVHDWGLYPRLAQSAGLATHPS